MLQLALWMRGTLTGPLQLVMDDLEVVTMDPETPDTVTNMTVTSDDDWLVLDYVCCLFRFSGVTLVRRSATCLAWSR